MVRLFLRLLLTAVIETASLVAAELFVRSMAIFVAVCPCRRSSRKSALIEPGKALFGATQLTAGGTV